MNIDLLNAPLDHTIGTKTAYHPSARHPLDFTLSLLNSVVIVSGFFKYKSLKESSVSLRPILVIIVAYLLGSIPFGYLIVRAKEGGDIRQTGSGGTGATNVSRRAGKVAGVLTLLLDALKGAAAVLIAIWVLSAPAVGQTEARPCKLRPHGGWLQPRWP